MSNESSAARTFRKRPVEVEAIRFEKPYKRAQEFCPALTLIKDLGGRIAFGQVKTLEGVMTAQLGDWIVRGVQGEFYPVKPDIFEETYEPVE